MELDPSDADRQGRVVSLGVQTSRKGVRLLVPARWTLRDDPLPEPPPPPAPTAASAAVAPGPSKADTKPTRGVESSPPDAELEAVLARTARYVDTYLAELGSVVAEEEYSQTVRRGSSVIDARRTKADLLLVRAAHGWIPFRDVFEVNGKAVRD